MVTPFFEVDVMKEGAWGKLRTEWVLAVVYNPEQDGACGTAIEEEGMVITHSLHM